MKFGLWDGECWLGNDKGPKVFDDEMMARAAVTVLYYQTGRRAEVRSLPVIEKLRLKGEIPVTMSAEEAVKKAEHPYV